MPHTINQFDPVVAPAALSDAQFQELKDLLAPISKLARLVLAERAQAADAPEKAG